MVFGRFSSGLPVVLVPCGPPGAITTPSARINARRMGRIGPDLRYRVNSDARSAELEVRVSVLRSDSNAVRACLADCAVSVLGAERLRADADGSSAAGRSVPLTPGARSEGQSERRPDLRGRVS